MQSATQEVCNCDHIMPSLWRLAAVLNVAVAAIWVVLLRITCSSDASNAMSGHPDCALLQGDVPQHWCPTYPLILASMTGQLILAKSSSSAFWPPMGARHLSIRSRCTSQKACSTVDMLRVQMEPQGLSKWMACKKGRAQGHLASICRNCKASLH